MKKARIVLAAIAILAVVGGTFAFTASKFTAGRLYYTTTTTTTTATIYSLHPSYNSVAGTPLEIPTTLYYTTPGGYSLFTGVTLSTVNP